MAKKRCKEKLRLLEKPISRRALSFCLQNFSTGGNPSPTGGISRGKSRLRWTENSRVCPNPPPSARVRHDTTTLASTAFCGRILSPERTRPGSVKLSQPPGVNATGNGSCRLSWPSDLTTRLSRTVYAQQVPVEMSVARAQIAAMKWILRVFSRCRAVHE
ncbi:hypothetical protein FHS27_006189 [Rhodopirellula rubra]|uniref:Uncharacterized protein n=1 Tax=Aporhodopirellula rubra TaxID=980271 RepID=A0A7W5E5T6_9BACT|nr:hypothetical protein [Aporhodopirellula rubra]